MRSNKFIIPAVLVLLLAVTNSCSKESVSVSGTDDSMLIQTKSSVSSDVWSAYDYCEKEGFWSNLGPLEERFDATQIPVDELSGYSAEELFILCLNNPLTLLYSAYNNELNGVDIVADNLSVFKEFEKREDAAATVLNVYQNMDIKPEQVKNCLYVNGKYSLSLLASNFVSLYIASARIPALFNLEYASRLKFCAERLKYIKSSNLFLFSWFSISKEALILRELCELEGGLPLKPKEQYLTLFSQSPVTKSIVPEEEPAGPFFRERIDSVYTRGGKQIEAYLYYEMTPYEIQHVDEFYRNMYPNEEFLNSSSWTYNCHSYAWNMYDSDDNPVCWINKYRSDGISENLSKYWTNDYYSEITTGTEAEKFANAEKIYYSDDDHSVVKISEDLVASKWGYGPRVKHSPRNCPFFTTGKRYFAHQDNRRPGTDPRPFQPGHDEDEDGDSEITNMTIFADSMERVGSYVTYTTTEMEDDLLWKLFYTGVGGSEITPIQSGRGAQYSFGFNNLGEYRVEVFQFSGERIIGHGTRTINIIR